MTFHARRWSFDTQSVLVHFLPNMCLRVASEVTLLEIPPCQTPMCGVAYSCSYALLIWLMRLSHIFGWCIAIPRHSDWARLGHVHVHDYRGGTSLLYWNDERIVVFLKRVGSFLSISYKVTHFYASQQTSTIVMRLRVNPTSHDWLRLSWMCPWPSKICPSCEWPRRCVCHEAEE